MFNIFFTKLLLGLFLLTTNPILSTDAEEEVSPRATDASPQAYPATKPKRAVKMPPRKPRPEANPELMKELRELVAEFATNSQAAPPSDLADLQRATTPPPPPQADAEDPDRAEAPRLLMESESSDELNRLSTDPGATGHASIFPPVATGRSAVTRASQNPQVAVEAGPAVNEYGRRLEVVTDAASKPTPTTSPAPSSIQRLTFDLMNPPTSQTDSQRKGKPVLSPGGKLLRRPPASGEDSPRTPRTFSRSN